ncbi:MAG: YicC/YloC family endoribonuclease [Bacteroidota bacterium]|nr:YicC/YloC family endoribonuclease [Bacteroidota bacterium]MDP4191859.1 YicC/YloC family endoribonuclease [Bacteroidota bacterium]MDP4195458.1 YicC/YloC family endoribonuclease [Bacteroidota bacterium]
MISSMTGFGKGSAQNENFSVETEIKSVNSRYLEISLKLPKSLQNKEYEIREIIRNKVKRGKIILNIQLKRNGAGNNKPSLSKESLDYALKFLKELKKEAKLREKITLNHLLMFQEMYMEETVEETEVEFILTQQALEQAVKELIVMRNKEGKELSKDLKTRIRNIEETVNTIETLSKESVGEYFDKLKERAKQMLGDISAYSERLEMELALLVDKSDITEECVRLKSHTKFFLENLDSSNEVGRKLNFLCQEINREANTIGSKTLSTEISHLTVFIKEELERIREQIQNIE